MKKTIEFLGKMQSIEPRENGGGYAGQSEDITLMQQYFDDDSETTLKKGDRVIHAKDEEGDAHKAGSQGTIIGAMIDEGEEIYMVKFDDDPEESLALKPGYKLQLVD